MNTKYEIVGNMCIRDNDGTKLYRIRALRDIDTVMGVVKRGDLGGYVASEANLTKFSDAWIFDDSVVRDNAVVRGGAVVRHSSVICDNALIGGKAKLLNSYVCGNATVIGSGRMVDCFVNQNAVVGAQTMLFKSSVTGNATVFSPQDLTQVTVEDCVGRMFKPNEERPVTKYLMIPEGAGLFRIKALRDIDNKYQFVKKGQLGGLISSSQNLSQSGDCWVFPNASVTQNATVQENASVVGGSEIYGDAVVCERAVVKDCIISGRSIIGGGVELDNYSISRYIRVLGEGNLINTQKEKVEIFGKTKQMVNIYKASDINRLKHEDNIFSRNF